MISALKRLRRDQRGAAAVEFAIISVVLIMLLVGLVDFGRTLYIKNQLSFLADQATRTVLMDPGVSGASLENTLRADFNAGDPNELTVSITATTVDGRDYRVITVDYPVTLFVPNLASSTVDLNVSRRVPAG